MMPTKKKPSKKKLKDAKAKPASKRASTKAVPAAKAPAKAAASTSRNGFHPGTYTAPQGNVSIAIPPLWNMRQTNDDIQVESEASETTVIVTAYHRNPDVPPLDARDYLKHFLETSPAVGKLQTGENSKQSAHARFRDEEGDNWFVRFLSNGETLLLATCHSNRPLTSREGKTGVAVLESIKLKARG